MIEFWISRDSDKLRLPVNPPSIDITQGHAHSEIKVMALGDISFPQGRDLCKYTFNSIFPAKYNPVFCEYANIKPPYELVAKIEGWVHDGQPVRLTITGSPINLLVTIRSVQYTPWKHGDSDIPYSLELVEYRVPTVVRTIAEKTAPSNPETSTTTSAMTGTVNVGKGSNLNVRKTASTTSTILGKLANGATMTITATVSGWYQIKTSNLSGYVSQKYVKVTASAPTATATATTTKERA